MVTLSLVVAVTTYLLLTAYAMAWPATMPR
jgi:hypothetical protein